ncbi:MAG: methionyl-tRNA formyltransferase [Candidatus Nomurabacteria bacterium]|nr:MAG: methionyl-tRNA formyltransferase [Candidatus Nomurabacteria bacterium]HRV75933.1 methionyl-tRNA formyltransferase [Candidatus Saccharimonadales bacterium]
MPKNIVFFGNERLASACTTRLPILNALLDSEYIIKLILISEKGTKSRNKRELEVKNFAKKNNIELFIPKDLDDLVKKLFEVNAEVGVLAAYGKIIPQEVIDIFPEGIINLHPSLLPKYRGPTPIESAILNGDHETGVSIMALESGMDSGPIYIQTKLKLNGSESKQNLADTLGELGAQKIIKVLKEEPTPKPQTGEPIICSLIKKEDSILDLSRPTETLEREIRAYLGWPGSKLTLNLKDNKELEITITEAEVTREDDKSPLTFKTSKDYLKVTKLKLPGKPEMTTKDFLNGYRNILGV